jgi:hypothetical protein
MCIKYARIYRVFSEKIIIYEITLMGLKLKKKKFNNNLLHKKSTLYAIKSSKVKDIMPIT